MIIDTHAHFTPQSMLEALKKEIGRFPNIELLVEEDSYKLGFSGGALTRPLSPKLRDADKRLHWMKDQCIDAQINGGWLDSFGYELPAEEGAAWSRFMNEYLMTGTEGHKPLIPLATVPLQNGKLAAEVLEEAMNAGFSGAMIGTQPHGVSGNLDDPDLDPFWEAASALKATLYLHPMFGCGDPRLLDFGMMNATGRGVDTTIAISRLLFTGHFLKYPDMNFILSHGGGALPYMLGRLARNVEIPGHDYADPIAGFKTLFFDTVLFDPRALNFLRDVVGAEKIMLGSDYPFPIGDMTPLKIIEDADLTEEERNLILGETAMRLFNISLG
ncbi:MAG: amidohydrolase family protein [Rhodospirillales bacterium]|jgi:aminocarboxymuconate-semialdehyde decarboxylase